MKTFLAIIGFLNLLVIFMILSPVLGIIYVLIAPLVLLIVILVAIIKKLTTRGKKEEKIC